MAEIGGVVHELDQKLPIAPRPLLIFLIVNYPNGRETVNATDDCDIPKTQFYRKRLASRRFWILV
jgi:hypothetical protein